MSDQQPRPDWAPDDAKPAVIQLITNEQQLEDLGLRGLSSADSTEFREAVRKLKAQLGGAFDAGKQAGIGYPPKWSVWTFMYGALTGAIGAALIAVAFFI